MAKIKGCIPIVVFILFLTVGICLAEGKRSNTQLNYMDYIEKASEGEKLSIEEFNILMQQLEKSMKSFREAFLKIRIEDANFTYADGKNWEIQLTFAKEQLERAFKYLPYVRKHPNIISNALQFYIDLNDVTQTAYEFAQIPAFDKKLNNIQSNLSLWNLAFRKAHLAPLAYAKDTNKKLYQDVEITK